MFHDFIERLYENIGGKIKGLAKWSFIIGSAIYIILALIYVIAGLVSGSIGLAIVGVLMGVLVPILLWISTWMTYAFGDLVEKANDIHAGIGGLRWLIANQQQEQQPTVPAKQQPAAPAKQEPVKTEKPKPAAPVAPIAPAPESPLVEKLEFALSYTTNTGMINYLKKLDDSKVLEILQRPEAQIRAGIEALVRQLKSE